MKRNKSKMKKGELTTENIVTLIVLIIGFIILLAFLVGFNYEEEVNQIVCKTSVLLKATSKQISGLEKLSTSLNCHTKYLCISSDNKCDKDLSISNVKKVSSSDEIFKILADELGNCWSMFGEGKLDYFSKFNIKTDLYCSLCSLIYFDKDLNEIKDENSYFVKDENGKVIGLNQTKFYIYLAKTKVGKSNENYLTYLYGISSFSQFNNYLTNGFIPTENSNIESQKNLEVEKLNNIPSLAPLNFSKNYFVLLGAMDNSDLLNILSTYGGPATGSLLGLAAGFIISPPSAIMWGALFVGGALIGQGVQSTSNFLINDLLFSKKNQETNKEESSLVFFGPNLVEANAKSLSNIKCSEINTIA
jgi:hypothetical protein